MLRYMLEYLMMKHIIEGKSEEEAADMTIHELPVVVAACVLMGALKEESARAMLH